jgi:DNA polymerase elongation subunit (family B)
MYVIKMEERKYTVISDKRDWDNNINYAIMYYWENGIRKIEQKEIKHNYFYSLPNVRWDPNKYRVLKGFKSVYGDDLNKVIIKDNLSIDEYKAIKIEHEGELYESDVRPLDRFLWEEKPKFSKNIRTWYLDIEILKDKKGQYSSVDEAKNKVSAITVYDNVLMKYYVLLLTDDVQKVTKTEIDDRIIYKFKKEKDLLLFFISLIEKLDPDCFTGWNVMGFDMPYLLYRMENLDIEYKRISPLYNVKFGRRGGNFDSYVTYIVYIKGRVIMDLMDISKLFWLGTDVGYSLESQSQKYLGEGKIKIGDIDQAYKDNFPLFVEYNIKDVKLCIDLDGENKLISNMQSFQDVISINLNETLIAGRTINSYIKQHSDIVLDNSDPKPVEKIPGGYVVPTDNGIFDDVIKFDFASHYPSFIRTYNVSPDTVVRDPTEEEKKNLIHFYCWYKWGDSKTGSSGAVVVLNPTEEEKKSLVFFEVYFRKDFRGSITKIVDDLTDRRLKYKKEGDVSLSTVYKRMINSIYGQFIYKYSRFFSNSCGKAITLGCQTLTKGVIDLIGYRNIAQVLLGDTDSFCAKMNPGHDTKELIESMDLIFQNLAEKHNLDPDDNYSRLELEDEIDKIILFGVKKKYVEKIGNKQKVVGLELIRKDFPLALKEFQQELINYIFNNDKAKLSGLREIRRDIKDKIKTKIILKEYDYFSMPTVIRKNIEEYENETAEKKALRNSKLKISMNETFYILPCVGEKDLAFKTLKDLDGLNYEPDYERIVDKVFANVGIWEGLFVKQTRLGDY